MPRTQAIGRRNSFRTIFLPVKAVGMTVPLDDNSIELRIDRTDTSGHPGLLPETNFTSLRVII